MSGTPVLLDVTDTPGEKETPALGVSGSCCWQSQHGVAASSPGICQDWETSPREQSLGKAKVQRASTRANSSCEQW